MHESQQSEKEEQWVIWNGAYGIVDTVTISRVEVGPNGRKGWLDAPYDMVGPISLDELETSGSIGFAACTVMSRQKWKDDQVQLRREAFERRRAAQERLFEDFARYNERRRERPSHFHQRSEKQHRELLALPIDGELASSQIKAAYRQLAKTAHPDVGGSHEQFILITEARDALLECIAYR